MHGSMTSVQTIFISVAIITDMMHLYISALVQMFLILSVF